jgi:mono/diheme cytochrome c family protein
MSTIRMACLFGLLAGSVMLVRAEEAEFKINGDAAKGAATFKLYCAACHGETGHGDGIAAAALTPKPRDLSEKAYMDTLSDQHIYTVIKDGGTAVGKSMFMTAWGAILKEDQAIHDVAAYVRTLAAE